MVEIRYRLILGRRDMPTTMIHQTTIIDETKSIRANEEDIWRGRLE